MSSTKTSTNSNWFTKFSLSFLAIVGGANSALFVIAPLLPSNMKPYIESAGLFILAIAILFSVGFSIYWHYKEKNSSTFNSEKCHTWVVTLLRYWIAFLVSMFGFEKIVEVNFAISYHANDSLVSALTGQELTWKYYAHSYSLCVIIGLLQLAGSALLLFRRTVLLGVTILLPVMFNIVLINLFYAIGPITCFTSLVITLGLSYLLFQRKEDIIALFRQYKSTALPIGNKTLRIAARVCCILIPGVFIVYYSLDVRRSEKYFGKWKVETMVRNGVTIPERAWETDASAWKAIYIEERGKMYCCANPNMYVNSASIFMAYHYDVKDNSFKAVSYEHDPKRPDTIPVQISKFDGKFMKWNMVLYKDTIEMELRKVELKADSVVSF